METAYLLHHDRKEKLKYKFHFAHPVASYEGYAVTNVETRKIAYAFTLSKMDHPDIYIMVPYGNIKYIEAWEDAYDS